MTAAATVGVAPQESEESRIRADLAACYRLMHKYAMTDLIYTHVSARLPGTDGHFLLNPFGLMFNEITASSLIEIDAQGNAVGAGAGKINWAGYVIHNAVLSGRPDVNCVVHTHTRAGVAISALECGLLSISQHAMEFHNRMAYHDYEGIADDLDECARLQADLGKHNALILRNHGLLATATTVGGAFLRMFNLEQACKIQLDAQAGGSTLLYPSEEICEGAARQFEDSTENRPMGWQALLRGLDNEGSSFRD
ncbi:MAG: class II aldolase/adducin family protein [Proteobacteria bacterium]|nr:class II aldolase/adducin family protein [Pseudomonadota bacterium]